MWTYTIEIANVYVKGKKGIGLKIIFYISKQNFP